MAWVGLEDLPFHAPHGVHPHERAHGGPFRLSLWWKLDVAAMAAEDDLTQGVDYSAVYALAAQHMAQPTQLIETVAHRLAQAVLDHWPELAAVRVHLVKEHPPLPAYTPRATVHLTLRRQPTA